MRFLIRRVAGFKSCRGRPEHRVLTDPSERLRVRLVPEPSAEWYGEQYRRIGEPWLWFSRRNLKASALEKMIRDSAG
jgi:hypothetical protein